MRACTHDIAVGKELVSLRVVILLRLLLDELSVVIELAEEITCKLVVRWRSGAAVDVERDTELLE